MIRSLLNGKLFMRHCSKWAWHRWRLERLSSNPNFSIFIVSITLIHFVEDPTVVPNDSISSTSTIENTPLPVFWSITYTVIIGLLLGSDFNCWFHITFFGGPDDFRNNIIYVIIKNRNSLRIDFWNPSSAVDHGVIRKDSCPNIFIFVSWFFCMTVISRCILDTIKLDLPN